MSLDGRRNHLAYEVQRLKGRGLSVRAIARTLRIARKTVAKILRDIQGGREHASSALAELVPLQTPRGSKLDDFEKQLRQWINEDRKKKLTVKRCLEMLRDEGFEGQYTIVRERVNQIRAELQPEAPAEVVAYVPGQRAEFDWSPYEFDGGFKVNLWNTTLSWSHATYAIGCLRTRQVEVLRCLRESFEAFGGVPHECITDSMPGVVDRWECEQPVINVKFLGFALHYGFEILIAPRRCPKAKPHAERFFLYHQENFLPGRKFPTFDIYQEQLEWWLRERAQVRPHTESKLPIVEMLAKEQGDLKPLPRAPYDTRDIVVRVVDPFGFVHHETNFYPVPSPVGERVYVCVDRASVEICDPRARRLSEHERLPDGAGIKLPQLPSQRRVHRYDLDDLVNRLGDWHDIAREYALKLRRSCRTPGPKLAKLLQLQLEWSLDDLVGAMRHAMEYHCHDLGALLRILEARYQPRSLDDRIGDASRQRIKELMKAHPIERRPLSSYRSLSGQSRHGDPELDSLTPSPEDEPEVTSDGSEEASN